MGQDEFGKESVAVGVDLGGTFIKFGFFTMSGRLLDKWKIPTTSGGDARRGLEGMDARTGIDVDDTVHKIVEEINGYMKRMGIPHQCLRGVGIGVPGAVNDRGMIINAPNLGWSMVDVSKRMEKDLGVSVFVENDANVAALGEQHFGAGEGCDSMVMVTLGTGVGGGVIVNQRLVAGAYGGAGEIGHMTINDRETVACTCGKKGCLEQYVSATGIARMAKTMLVTALAEDDEKKPGQGEKEQDAAFQYAVSTLQEYKLDGITAKEVFDAVKAGDTLAIQVAEIFGKTLGRALSLVAGVIDPQMFVIGGGVSAAGDVLLTYIEKYYRSYAFSPSKKTLFRLAELGNDAGICGAARMVMLENQVN